MTNKLGTGKYGTWYENYKCLVTTEVKIHVIKWLLRELARDFIFFMWKGNDNGLIN
jgi:hypothetical protein